NGQHGDLIGRRLLVRFEFFGERAARFHFEDLCVVDYASRQVRNVRCRKNGCRDESEQCDPKCHPEQSEGPAVDAAAHVAPSSMGRSDSSLRRPVPTKPLAERSDSTRSRPRVSASAGLVVASNGVIASITVRHSCSSTRPWKPTSASSSTLRSNTLANNRTPLRACVLNTCRSRNIACAHCFASPWQRIRFKYKRAYGGRTSTRIAFAPPTPRIGVTLDHTAYADIQ